MIEQRTATTKRKLYVTEQSIQHNIYQVSETTSSAPSKTQPAGLFPPPQPIERVETPDQKKRRELQAQSMLTQRQNLKRLLERRLRRAQEQGNENLLRQLRREYRESYPEDDLHL